MVQKNEKAWSSILPLVIAEGSVINRNVIQPPPSYNNDNNSSSTNTTTNYYHPGNKRKLGKQQRAQKKSYVKVTYAITVSPAINQEIGFVIVVIVC
jgi:hypothetical protein